MTQEYAKHEKDLIQKLTQEGYTASYRVVDGQLVNVTTKKAYGPKEVSIEAEHRYEGMSNPSDMSILYAIKTSDGEKGTFLAGYGPTANIDSASFFKKVAESN